MEILFLLILVFLVITLSGLISGSEAAILSIHYPKIKEMITITNSKKKTKRLESLLEIKDNLQKYITTLVVLNNIVNIVGSIYIGAMAAKLFGEFYLGVVSGVLTFLIIVFSEIIPKVYGEKYSDKIAPKISSPIIFLTSIFYPLIFLLNKITEIFIKNSGKNHVSEGVIKEMALLGRQEGTIDTYESDLIENVFEMDDIEVYDIMVPAKKVVSIDINTKFGEIVSIARKTGYTRFPITKNGSIVGSINVKDLFRFYGKEKTLNIEKILRTIEYAPESMKILTLDKRLRRKRKHMAVVVNEHGDFIGIVTLEDIIEELVGEIEDEFDAKDTDIKKIKESVYEVDASCEIEKIEEKFKLDLGIDEDYTTVNGFIITKLGRIPNAQEIISFKGGTLKIIKANDKQVLTVELSIK